MACFKMAERAESRGTLVFKQGLGWIVYFSALKGVGYSLIVL